MILIFGATGDLAKKKLLPALFTLYKKKKLVDTPIVAIGRRALTKDQFIDEMNLRELEERDAATFHTLTTNLSYHQVDFTDKNPISFVNNLHELDKKHQCNGRKLCYLATSYTLFGKILDFLNHAGLFDKVKTQIAFEKPFGFDKKSAKKLQKNIISRINEKNVYRVDHYLGKSMVDILLTLRRVNPMFSALWNAKHVDNVQLVLAEDFGIEGRGEYYDRAGAIRDVVQNHLLQMLALVSMELPANLNAESLRTEKVRVIKKLIAPKAKDIVQGQYAQYKQESDVSPDSKTETFLAFKTYIKTARWSQVPFYIKTGKYLDKKYSEINLVLKADKDQKQNIISIRLGPEQEGIAIQSYSHAPEQSALHPITLEYCHRCEFGPNTSEAYERIFLEMLKEDQTIFTRWDEIDASWSFIEKLIKNTKKTPLHIYARNSRGPLESNSLVNKDKREWVYVERKITI